MSGTPGRDDGATDDDGDLRAGEYVLGLGEAAERRTFEAECATDAALAHAVAAWERRLAPLTAGFVPVAPPPALWQRIAQSAFGTTLRPSASAPARGTWARRLGSGAVGFALAASIAAVVILERPLPDAIPVAALLPKTAGAPVLVALRGPGGSLVIRAVSPLATPPGHDYELWSLPANAKAPSAIGLLRHGQATVAASLVPGGAAQILVSLEASGGSSTGAPQGPVLWGGVYGGGS